MTHEYVLARRFTITLLASFKTHLEPACMYEVYTFIGEGCRSGEAGKGGICRLANKSLAKQKLSGLLH
jgi:hypothetical protein